MTARITREFRLAKPKDVRAGVDWYKNAHKFAEDLGFAHGLTLSQASAVIAVLSPQISWDLNVRAAAKLLETGDVGGVLGANVNKAKRIIDGEPESEVMGGKKVRSFYQCILTAGRDEYAVCVDRHAHALAIGSRDTPSLTARRYDEAADAFRRATQILNEEEPFELRPILTPSAVQATVWITWRRRFWKDGAFDPKGF